jgi:hypothetical protein
MRSDSTAGALALRPSAGKKCADAVDVNLQSGRRMRWISTWRRPLMGTSRVPAAIADTDAANGGFRA